MPELVSLDDPLAEFEYWSIGMDIPKDRRRDWAWLGRNLHIKNKNHKHYDHVIEIVRLLQLHSH